MADLSDSVVSNNVNTSKELSVVQNNEALNDNKTDKVMELEPILVEDFTFLQQPQTVKNLIKFLETIHQTTHYDILAGLIYILFLESGFESIQDIQAEDIEDEFNYKRLLVLTRKLPNDWKTGSSYNFIFVLPAYQQHIIRVTCLLVGDDFILNCIVNDVENAQYSVCLDHLLYYIDSSTVPTKSLQNLKHLSRIVKDMAFFAKQDVIRANDDLCLCLELLPLELLQKILCNLSISDLHKFGRVSQYCCTVSKSAKIWLHHLQKDFGNELSPEEQSWWPLANGPALKDIYIRLALRKRRRTIRPHRLFVEHMSSRLQRLHHLPRYGEQRLVRRNFFRP